mmetsp:Transcript_17727/g.49191  ORF Transcript_17727/g.49191 Transcript_17727/m.49191 type:complete len:217 (+) Transcript_17727:213-863(+)|eukprot:CAMPEP_0198121550 /NCGR_PEP_ID=MMETSP1442-20131203/32437_1 /TAXON_ID= /ORGANISM="Craspedostauros australis, Strain CCMP3328" /LENGTH=216 /DNA_ID=CAMNT_0043780387 /DNA_START=147 /DNA_END=797 /DNA_ORIENTATION=-
MDGLQYIFAIAIRIVIIIKYRQDPLHAEYAHRRVVGAHVVRGDVGLQSLIQHFIQFILLRPQDAGQPGVEFGELHRACVTQGNGRDGVGVFVILLVVADLFFFWCCAFHTLCVNLRMNARMMMAVVVAAGMIVLVILMALTIIRDLDLNSALQLFFELSQTILAIEAVGIQDPIQIGDLRKRGTLNRHHRVDVTYHLEHLFLCLRLRFRVYLCPCV